MAVLLALTSAVVYGAADFCGGLAARRAAALAVVAVSQLAGLVTLLALLPALGGDPAPAGLAWGAAAGLAGAVGLVLFYRALAAGVMSVVAPVTAVCAAGLPVLVGLGRGEHVAALGVAGIGLGLVAVGLVAAENGLPTVADLRQARVLPAVVAGTAFGVFFVLLDQPRPDSGLWPLVGARLASIALILGAALATRRTVRIDRAVLPVVLLAGVGDMAANALFLLATRAGLLAVTGLLASLYPVSTVVLAQIVLRERLVRLQVAGLAGATLAVLLIALPR